MKISIVTATYNSGATLSDTIESILRQTYKDIELIIVDGGSKDNTLDIIDHYRPVFGDRIKIISEKDQGIYDAMNKGVYASTGDVIGILNSDDYYTENDILENIAKRMADPDIDAVYGDLHFVNGETQKCVRYYSSRLFRPFFMLMGFIPPHPTFYCRKTMYDKYGLYNITYRIAADFDLILRMVYVNKIRAVYLPMDFVTMRVGGASTANIGCRWQGLKDHHRALKSNHVFCNFFLLNLLFVYRSFEIILTPWLYKRSKRRIKKA